MLSRLLSALDLVGASGDTTCATCDEPISEESLYSSAVALGIALLGVLVFSLVLSGTLIEDWKRSNRPSVLATVTSKTLHAEGSGRLAVIGISFDFKGSRRDATIYRRETPVPLSSDEGRSAEQAFLAEHRIGSRVQVWVDPENPQDASLTAAPLSIPILALLVALAVIPGGVDGMAKALWTRARHHACKRLAPDGTSPDERGQTSSASFAHWRGLYLDRLIGPRSSWTPVIVGVAVFGSPFLGPQATLPWVLTLAAVAGVAAVFLVQLLRHSWAYWRLRGSWLRLEKPHALEQGGTYQASLKGLRGQVEITCESRDEEEWCFDLEEDFEPSGRTSKIQQRGKVLSQERQGDELLVTLRLPYSPIPSERWEGSKRRIWTLRAQVVGGVDALYELDFSPAEVPVYSGPGVEVPGEWLDSMRARLGELRGTALPPPPDWLGSLSPLSRVYRAPSPLFHAPTLTWAHLVQANSRLYEEGENDHPAMLLYSLDPEVSPTDLRRMARILFDTKEAAVDRLSQILADEHIHCSRYELPHWLSYGKRVFAAGFMVLREHLPRRRLETGFFPLLVSPEKTRAVMILPSELWNEEFLLWWSEDDEEDNANDSRGQ